MALGSASVKMWLRVSVHSGQDLPSEVGRCRQLKWNRFLHYWH
jgi:hypothetical protein